MLTGEGGEQKVERSDMVGVGEKRREGDEEIIKRLKTEIQTGKQSRLVLLSKEKKKYSLALKVLFLSTFNLFILFPSSSHLFSLALSYPRVVPFHEKNCYPN